MKSRKPSPSQSAPPPSLAGLQEAESASECHDGFKEVTMEFADEFAPSVAQFSTTDVSATDSAFARHFFYNDQIHQTLASAIDRAAELGFPNVDYTFGLGFVSISDAQFRWVAGFGHRICPTLKEGSEDWLCVQCYLRWVSACWTFTDGPTVPPKPTGMTAWMTEAEIAFRKRSIEYQSVAEAMFFLGAAVRELELHRLNRNDALRGKKTVRGARQGGEGRQSALAPDTEHRIAEMARLVPSHGIKGAAEVLFRNGSGASAVANRQLWYRHNQK